MHVIYTYTSLHWQHYLCSYMLYSLYMPTYLKCCCIFAFALLYIDCSLPANCISLALYHPQHSLIKVESSLIYSSTKENEGQIIWLKLQQHLVISKVSLVLMLCNKKINHVVWCVHHRHHQGSWAGGAAERPRDPGRAKCAGGPETPQRGLQQAGERQEHTDRAADQPVRNTQLHNLLSTFPNYLCIIFFYVNMWNSL